MVEICIVKLCTNQNYKNVDAIIKAIEVYSKTEVELVGTILHSELKTTTECVN